MSDHPQFLLCQQSSHMPFLPASQKRKWGGENEQGEKGQPYYCNFS